MPRTIDPDNLTFVILDLTRMFRAAFERAVACSSLDMTPAEARLLAHLARFAPARPGTLAAHLGMTAMSVTEYAGKLEAAGYVERVADPDDRRAKLICLTDKADTALGLMREIGDGIRQQAKGDLTDEEWAQLRTLLLAARKNMAARND